MEEIVKITSDILRKNLVRYVVIGGIANFAWGVIRATADVDIVVVLDDGKIADVLDDFGASGFVIPKDAAQRLSRGLAVKLKFKELSVDLRSSSYTIDAQAIERARQFDVFGTRVPIASKEDLIVYKLAHFSYQDRADIQGVLGRQKQIDFSYITDTATQLGQESGRTGILDNLADVKSWAKG